MRLGITEHKDAFIIATGAGLVFEVSQHNGDLTSMKFHGRECQAPVDKGARNSHYASGLSGGSKITSEKDPGGNWVMIIVEDDKIGVTHYYIARQGENNIYMADYAEKSPPPGEMRFITYLDREVFTHVPLSSDIRQADGGVEGKDVFQATPKPEPPTPSFTAPRRSSTAAFTA